MTPGRIWLPIEKRANYASAVVLPVQTAPTIKIGRHLLQLVLCRRRRRRIVLRGLGLGWLTLLLQPNILRGR